MNECSSASATYQLWDLGQVTLHLWVSVLLPLNCGLANAFCKGLDGNYFRLCRSHGLCCNYSTLP